jgi:hypothetical protein
MKYITPVKHKPVILHVLGFRFCRIINLAPD